MSHHDPRAYPPGYLEEYCGNAVISYSIVFLVLTAVFMGLRFWSRYLGNVPWGLDDNLIIASAFFLVGVITACLCDVAYGGVGYHAARITAEDPGKLIIWAKFLFVFPFVYAPAVALPKLSILALYLRVFATRRNSKTRMTCWATIAIILVNFFATFLVTFFICRPIAFLWNRTIPGGTCININAWWSWSSLANIITDVMMMFIPIPTILKLQAPKKVKVGVVVTFITGSIGLVTAIIRFHDFFTTDYMADPTWTAAQLFIVTIAEPGLYTIAACLLALRPLFKLVLEKAPMMTSTFKDTNSSMPKSELESHIMQKTTFKVTKSERFPQQGDEEELIENALGSHGHTAEVGRGTSVGSSLQGGEETEHVK